jgi:hypothetical protein
MRKDMPTTFTIGCDPEFFLRERTGGKLVSAIPFITGTKEQPQPLPAGGNIQRDNVAVEFATDPADSREAFVAHVEATMKAVAAVLPAHTELAAIPSASFAPEELQHPDALRFGCDPDYDAWECRENDPPCALDSNFRSCGAHIHVGSTGADENTFLLDLEGKLNMVKAMDCIHGVISTVLDASPEAVARRQLYGKPGSHRPKDYGVEYRVLSNYWLKSPVTVMLMHSLTADALAVVRNGQLDSLIDNMGEHEVKRVIIEGDTDAALKMIEVHLIPVLSKDSMFYFNEALAKVRNNDMDFHVEWGLYGKEKVV